MNSGSFINLKGNIILKLLLSLSIFFFLHFLFLLNGLSVCKHLKCVDIKLLSSQFSSSLQMFFFLSQTQAEENSVTAVEVIAVIDTGRPQRQTFTSTSRGCLSGNCHFQYETKPFQPGHSCPGFTSRHEGKKQDKQKACAALCNASTERKLSSVL